MSTPDLKAPAPRTADGKPDLSGIWDIEHNRPCPPEGCADMEIGQEFFGLGDQRWFAVPTLGGRSFGFCGFSPSPSAHAQGWPRRVFQPTTRPAWRVLSDPEPNHMRSPMKRDCPTVLDHLLRVRIIQLAFFMCCLRVSIRVLSSQRCSQCRRTTSIDS